MVRLLFPALLKSLLRLPSLFTPSSLASTNTVGVGIIGRGGLGALLLGEKPKMYEVALVDEKWVEEDKVERQEEEEPEEGFKKEKALGLWGDITVRFRVF